MMDPAAAALRDRLRWKLIAAAATPLEFDEGIVDAYLRGLVADGVDALAVLAHTGRGPYLPPVIRDSVIRIAVGIGVPVIVGVAELAEASRAAELGADGLLVFPPTMGVVEFHDALWQAAGLPMLAFDLYTRPLSEAVLPELLAHPGVAGLKVARLHDAVACQAVIDATNAADRLAITGEDRMFGPSLMWGAQSALVGLAAAAVPVTARVLRAFADKDYARFVADSALLDRFAAVAFGEPVEGYVQRMLWVAAAEGRIPHTHSHDPYGPGLPDVERERILAAARDAV
ncbi:dihydrodipicolinate synthase family protein [Allorhizocola rhizosphaerae]|uniref:dihydrodipicolinate synthase family protein n=1 Tax=Allorhizocola rhizosphaerae TaxID=1872709 RepID=UPI001B8D8999|nr:dihydrodipicolinate synthase family protein [Allorhizocola rhizosphaerae]